MDINQIKTGMRVVLNQNHPKVICGEAGRISQRKTINDKVMLEVSFDNGTRVYIKPEVLDAENISKEEILSIEKKTYSNAERAVYIAKRIIKEKNILERVNSLDQQEKDLKKKIEDIKQDKKRLLDASRKIEEAARRLTKIKALGSDIAIITQINDSIPVD